MNNKRLSLVNNKLRVKKLANRSPYFTALQYINNIETLTSPKTTFHRQESKFFQKKTSSGLNIICQFVLDGQNVNKPLARALRYIIIKILLSGLSLRSFTLVFQEIVTTMR